MKLLSKSKLLAFTFLSTQIVLAEPISIKYEPIAINTHADEKHNGYDVYHTKPETSEGLKSLVVKYQLSHREKAMPISKSKLAELIDRSECVDKAMREYAKMFFGKEADPTIQSILKIPGVLSVTPHVNIVKDVPTTEPHPSETVCEIPGYGRAMLRPWISFSSETISKLSSKLGIAEKEPWAEVLIRKEGKTIVDPELKEAVYRAAAGVEQDIRKHYEIELRRLSIEENHPIFKAMPKN